MFEIDAETIVSIENVIYSGDFANASQLLAPLLISHPDEPALYRLKLMAASENFRRQEIEKLIHVVQQKFPNSAESALADALTPGISALKCTRRLNKAMRLKPKDAFLYYLRGRNAINKSSYISAVVDFNECLRINPHIIKAYLLRSESLSQIGMHEYALRDLVTFWNRQSLENPRPLLVRMMNELLHCIYLNDTKFGSMVIIPEGLDIDKILHERNVWDFIRFEPLRVTSETVLP